tara:strand:+ start:318 stop:488 length:171 start_codon:yes stop_codon:yes gene_type:complete
LLTNGAGTMGILSLNERDTPTMGKSGLYNMNNIFLFVFTFLGLMTLLSIYMLVVVL